MRTETKHLKILAASLITIGIAVAQNPNSHTAHVRPKGPAVATVTLIDGSVHPELITDQEAITVFWISLMEPPGADEAARNRFAAKISKIKLDPSESALVWTAAQKFYRDFMPLRDRAQALADSAVAHQASTANSYVVAQQRAAVANSVDQLALNFHTSLLVKLSPSAVASFRANLADVKAHMKIVPPPSM
jgi:hypothetical protein